MAVSTYPSIITLVKKIIIIITLTENGLNALIERHRVAEWTQKQDSSICCLQETHFRSKDTK